MLYLIYGGFPDKETGKQLKTLVGFVLYRYHNLLFNHYGFTVENVVEKALLSIKKSQEN